MEAFEGRKGGMLTAGEGCDPVRKRKRGSVGTDRAREVSESRQRLARLFSVKRLIFQSSTEIAISQQ